MIYGEGSEPLAIAHRGGAALAQENSLAAFALASALGLRYLETDIRVTADGQLVCFHDDTLERVTLATGLVRSKPLRDLRRLRINGIEPIPKFDEALVAFPQQCFTVDLKDQSAIEPLVKSLRRKGVAQRVCIAGAWDGWLGHVRSEVPEAIITNRPDVLREVLISRDQWTPMPSRYERPTDRWSLTAAPADKRPRPTFSSA